MKLISLLLIAFCTHSAIAQNPLAEVTIHRLWNARKDVPATPGTSYKWIIPGDTAYYFKGVEGKQVEATVTFKEVGVVEPPPPPTVYTYDIDATGTNVQRVGTWIQAFKAAGTSTPTMLYNAPWTDNFSNDNLVFTHTTGSYVQHTFIGDSVHVIGERRVNHGTANITITKGTQVIVNKDVNTYLNTSENKPSVIHSGKLAGYGTYTVKVTFKEPATGATNSIVLDGFRVFTSQPQGSVEPDPDPIPDDPHPSPVDIISVSPSQNVKQIIEAAVNKTIYFTPGNYNLPYINVPASVNLDGAPNQVNIVGTQTSANDQGAVFSLKGGIGNQFIRNLNINGNNLSSGGIFVQRDNVTIENVKITNCKFFGLWTHDNRGFKWINNTLINNSWSSTQWCSGELVLGGQLSNFDISGGLLQSTDSKRGYAVKVLWNNPAYNRLTNGKIHGIRVDMQHYSAWGNGMSRNIGIEFADVDIYETVEIYDCTLENQTSFALGKENPGTIIVRNNVMRGEGDTYAIETICNNLVLKDCQIYETAMIIANFRSNKKVRNILIDNVTFYSPNGGALSYGALIYIGELGAENIIVRNSNIDRLPNFPTVRFRVNNSTFDGPGVRDGVSIEANNTIF